MMLESLDSIPWSDLQHAYGTASNVPVLIRSLLSLQDERRVKARRELANVINHQGTAYQATPYVIPFLFELVQDGNVRDRHLLIRNLVGIAIGLESDYLPYRFNLRSFRDMLEARAATLTDKQRSEFSTGPHIDLACYEGVNTRAEVFVSLLEDDLDDIRIGSAFALCWFPECSDALPLIKQRLKLRDAECRELANFVLAYGLLSYHSDVRVQIDLLSPLLDHPVLYVRVATAIAMAKTVATRRVLDVLQEGASSEELQNIFETICFNEGDVQDYARKVIDAIALDR